MPVAAPKLSKLPRLPPLLESEPDPNVLCCFVSVTCLQNKTKNIHFQSISALHGNQQRKQNPEKIYGRFERFLILVALVGRQALADPCQQVAVNLNDELAV